MSNEPKHPKYSFNSLRGCFYDGEKLISIPDACTELNRLESEVERLKGELKEMENIAKKEMWHSNYIENQLARCKSERNTMGLFPTSPQIVEQAEKFIVDYNGCNDHYVKRAYMIRMAQWVEEQFRASQQTQEGKG